MNRQFVYRPKTQSEAEFLQEASTPILTPVFRKLQAFLGFPLELEPVQGLDEAGETASDHWTITGADPYFRLLWAGGLPLAAGHYRLSIAIPQGLETLSTPIVYVDSGRSFDEFGVVRLHARSQRATRLRGDLLLPHGARSLRFDPSTVEGTFSTGEARLRRITRIEYYVRLMRDVWKRQHRTERSLWRNSAAALRLLWEGGFKRFAAELRRAGHDPQFSAGDYQRWIKEFDTFDEQRSHDMRARLDALECRPLISVLMPVHDTPEPLLRAAIQSVRDQVYQNWELCIADDHSGRPHVARMLNEFAEADPRIKVVLRGENGHIANATNSAFDLARGEWIALLDHDDLLAPAALGEVALYLAAHPDTQMIYTDEDKLSASGKRIEPYFKPDFSRELFRSQNYLNHLTLHRAENVRAVGGWRPGFEGSQDYDLNLRIFERIDAGQIGHIPKVLYHWRAVKGSTASAVSEKTYAHSAGLRALQDHVARVGVGAAVETAPGTPYYRIRPAVPDPAPLVSLVIPTKDKAALLRGCVGSIRDKTTYRNYEIIVIDNGSTERETVRHLEDISALPNVRVLRYDKPFNFSAINNFAVRHARGSLIGLINDDIEVISPDWLTELVSWAVQPDIGCVGAKLYYANETIQHAGVILGIGGVAGHSHKYFPREAAGYFSRLKVVQNLSAVTGACLVVRKAVYDQVGGLDESNLAVAFNDVDFCLRVRRAGYLNVWTPYAELYHLESASRGAEDSPEKARRFQREVEYMLEQWDFSEDAYYSRHLTREREDFSIAMKPAEQPGAGQARAPSAADNIAVP